VIGVIAKDSETAAVREFFQLFKTPWEFYAPHRRYDMLLVTSEEFPADACAKLVMIFNSKATQWDQDEWSAPQEQSGHEWLMWDGVEFPVYGQIAVLPQRGRAFIRHAGTRELTGIVADEPKCRTVRIGYDLFQEVSFLLSQGQPTELGHIPTFEIHIALLRDCMRDAGLPFVEVPPVAAGSDFMACLTHDVDFTGIRQHKFDHTMWGFLYRATVGCLLDALRGKVAWSKVATNWKAALFLPLVYLGLRDDFWLEFDRYLEIEKGLGSTFFFLPYKDQPGVWNSKRAPKRRAAKYDLMEIRSQVQALAQHGCEIGLHGIDAWHDSQKARAELSRISAITGQSDVGVRMHWLYFSENSPRTLQKAGFSYDSTFGYNDGVGFRAGTAQAFCPPGAEYLLELPLHIQDTALFYPGRMKLSESDALDCCTRLTQFVSLFGGALTINWHTRSLSPERLWGDFYARLLDQIQDYRVWFATAEQVIRWFRMRRPGRSTRPSNPMRRGRRRRPRTSSWPMCRTNSAPRCTPFSGTSTCSTWWWSPAPIP